MVTDEERRKVAANLRDSAGNSEVMRDAFLEEILVGDTGLWFAEDIEIDTLLYHLADLIEPPARCPHYMYPCCWTDAGGDYIDRDALLALADEMTVDKGDIWRWSSRIRKALGVER